MDPTRNNDKYKDMTIPMGGDFQATPQKDDERSYYPPLNQFCKKTCLSHITKDIYTIIPAKTHLDHWLLRHPHTPQRYTINNTHTHTTTYTPENRDHKALILNLPQIGDNQLHNANAPTKSPLQEAIHHSYSPSHIT